MKGLKKLDYFNLCGIVLAMVGAIVAVVGGQIFSAPIGIGFNFNLSPVLFAGIGMMLVALVLAITGTILTEKHQLNKKLSTAALYISTLAVMLVIVYVILIITMPVLRPTNG